MALVLWFPCLELTYCCTQHETNVRITMRLSQLLFFQVWSCCPLLLFLLLLLLYFFLLMLLLSSSLSLYGGGLGCGTEAHVVMHLPAEVWGEGETPGEWLLGERQCLSVDVVERQKEGRVQGYSERKRLWERVSASLECSEDRGTMLGIYARLMGPWAEYTEGQQGSACTFLFT